MAPDDLRVNIQEGTADVLGEGEIGVPVAPTGAAVELIVEDAADPARLVPVFEEEVIVAPGLETGV